MDPEDNLTGKSQLRRIVAMLNFWRRLGDRGLAMKSEVEQLASVLVDQPANSPDEVFRRCRAADSRSLRAAVAEAIGHCSQGRWNGPSYSSDARDVLMKLAAFDDDRVRKSASMAMAELEGIPAQPKSDRN